MPIKIHLLTNSKFLGDKNQALGIKKMLEKRYPAEEILVQEWDDGNEEKLISLTREIEAGSKFEHIVIGIGDHGLEAHQKINIKPTLNRTSIWAGHQPFPKLFEIAPTIDLVALPAHVLDEKLRREIPAEKLIETIGVAHNVDFALLSESKQKWQRESKNAISPSDNYIGVILGGDAPDSSGTMHLFTAPEARRLAHFVKQMAEQHFAGKRFLVLITNGPRTGKYDPTTKAEMKVHTSGSPLDLTSLAFVDEFNKIGLTNYQFFNFETGKPSAYQPILATLQECPSNIAIVTGDSTSMVTEISDSMGDKPTYVVNVNSMSSAHIAHIRSIGEEGVAHVVDLGETVTIRERGPKAAGSQVSAAESIAKAISALLTKKSIIERPSGIAEGLTRSGMGIGIDKAKIKAEPDAQPKKETPTPSPAKVATP